MATVKFNYNRKEITYTDARGSVVTPFSALKRLTPLRARQFYEARGWKLVSCIGRKTWIYEKAIESEAGE
jgi:hypothetical protein